MIRLLTEVKNRLHSLGISVSSEPGNADEVIISFSIDKVTNHIKNQTNLDQIPEGLFQIAVDMVIGEFLFSKKSMGLLKIETLDFGLIEKQVQAGDTNVTFAVDASLTPEAQFNAFVKHLRHEDTSFSKFRVLTW